MKLFLCLILAISILSCTNQKLVNTSEAVNDKTYLALGDSYTIGEGVDPEQSFPYQLVSRLNESGVKTLKPEIVAVTGWTTRDLLRGIAEKKISRKYDFVSLQIGVNNQYSKLSPVIYRKEFKELLSLAIDYSLGGRSTVYVISIPDWSVTPLGRSRKDYNLLPLEIDKFNAINKEESLKENVHYIDITPASRFALTDPSLIAADSLHPSGKMYTEWVKLLYPLVKKKL